MLIKRCTQSDVGFIGLFATPKKEHLLTLEEGSATFLKLRATSRYFNVKGYLLILLSSINTDKSLIAQFQMIISPTTGVLFSEQAPSNLVCNL